MITSTALPIADPRAAEALVTTNRPALAPGERREVGAASFAAILADRKPQVAPVLASRVPDAVATGQSGAESAPATAVSMVSGPKGAEAGVADPDMQPTPPDVADGNDQDLQNRRGAAFDTASVSPTGLVHPDQALPDREMATLPRLSGMSDGLSSFMESGLTGDHADLAIPLTTADDDTVPVRPTAATALAEPPSQAPSAGQGRDSADLRVPGPEGSQAAPWVKAATPARDSSIPARDPSTPARDPATPARHPATPARDPSILDQNLTTDPRTEAARPPAAGDVRAPGQDLGALATRHVAGANPVAGEQTTSASGRRAGTEGPATSAPKATGPGPSLLQPEPRPGRAGYAQGEAGSRQHLYAGKFSRPDGHAGSLVAVTVTSGAGSTAVTAAPSLPTPERAGLASGVPYRDLASAPAQAVPPDTGLFEGPEFRAPGHPEAQKSLLPPSAVALSPYLGPAVEQAKAGITTRPPTLPAWSQATKPAAFAITQDKAGRITADTSGTVSDDSPASPSPAAVGAKPVALRAVSQAVAYWLAEPAAFSLTADLQKGDVAQSELGGVAASALSGSAPTYSDPAAEARLVRHLVPQFAAALPHAVQGTDLQLNPEELGKVRLTVHTQDAVLVLQVQADRPETADLIRRHVAELLQEFRAMGYTDVSVNLGGSGQDRRQASAPGAQAGVETGSGAVNMPDNITHPQNRHGSSGLDLRL